MGQSNQVGRADMIYLPANLEGDIADILTYTDSGYEILNASEKNNNQYPSKSDQYSYMTQFLDTLKNKQNDIYCLKYAIGGTPLAEVIGENDWNINNNNEMFTNAMTFINNSILDLNELKYKPDIFIHWFSF